MRTLLLVLAGCSDFDLKPVEDEPTPGTVPDTATTPETSTDSVPTTPPDTCMGLGEAWDRGLLGVRTDGTGSTLLATSSSSEEICVDGWYVVLSEESQDAGLGDPLYDGSLPYPEGTLTLRAGDQLAFGYSDSRAPAWWCVEEFQTTAPNKEYSFTGAYVPDAVLDSMLAGSQDRVWNFQNDSALIIVGRGRNYMEVAPGGSETVSVSARNMGSRPASARVWETVPAGFSASGFSPSPDDERANGDGSTSYGFDLSLDSRRAGSPTTYSESVISYTLATPADCTWRTAAPKVAAEWTDRDGVARTSEGNPFIIYCN